MSTADDLAAAAASAAQKARSVSADGQTVTRNSPADIIEAAKFSGANEALNAVAQGRWPFPRMIIVPPGAGGDSCH